MKYLEFEVRNMQLFRVQGDNTVIFSGAKDYYGLQFTFDEDFENLVGTKYCIIAKPSMRISKRIELDSENKCEIPNSFIRDGKPIEVRIVNGNQLGTPFANINVLESGEVPPYDKEMDFEDLYDTSVSVDEIENANMATTEDVANKVNEIIQALVTKGIITN